MSTDVSLEEIEEALYVELEKLYASGSITALDRALRLGMRLRKARGGSFPIWDGRGRGGTKGRASKDEQVIAIRALTTAGMSLADIQAIVCSKEGMMLAEGVRWRLTKKAWAKLLNVIAAGESGRTRNRDTAAIIRGATLDRMTKVAADAAADGNYSASLKANEMVLEYLDEVAPTAPPAPEDAAEELVGELFRLEELKRFAGLFEMAGGEEDSHHGGE